MSELLLDMEADQANASAIEKMENTGLKSIAEIARAARNQEEVVNNLEDQLKAAKRELLKLTDEDLPAMLQELGLSSFELDDGSKVTVRPTYGAHIKAENRETAFDWLRQNGFDDIIKNTVSCNFGRGEDREAAEFIDYDHAAFAALIMKAWRVVRKQTTKKVSDNPLAFVCRYCNYKPHCWPSGEESLAISVECKTCRYAKPVGRQRWFCTKNQTLCQDPCGYWSKIEPKK